MRISYANAKGGVCILTRDQIDALEQLIYNAAMGGDVRSGLALLKLQYPDADAPQSGGIVILPAHDISLTDYEPAPAKATYTSGTDYTPDAV